MRAIFYIVLNAFMLATLVINFIDSDEIVAVKLITYSIAIVFLNVCFLIGDFLISYLSKVIYYFWEKSEKKKYNLYKWLGDVGQDIYLYKELSNIKGISEKDVSENISDVKDSILKIYNDSGKLNEYRVLLEVRAKSDKLKSLRVIVQTFLAAGAVPLLVNIITWNTTEYLELFKSVIFFGVIWFGLLYMIKDLSNVIDRNNLLLEIVNMCISEQNDKSIETDKYHQNNVAQKSIEQTTEKSIT